MPRRHEVLELDLLSAIVRVFCLGETIAVPLFRHLREPCTEPVARAALDRILRDEVRHRDFGWDALDWLCTTSIADAIPGWIAREWPALQRELAASYGELNAAISADTGELGDADRAWGLASPRDYAEILARTIERDYRPRFAARGIAI